MRDVALYGGAMRTKIPTSFRDMSRFCTVPDNQEVFEDEQSECKLIIELLERQTITDEHMGSFLFKNIAKENQSDEYSINAVEHVLPSLKWEQQLQKAEVNDSQWVEFEEILNANACNTVKADLLAFSHGPLIPYPLASAVIAVHGDQSIVRQNSIHRVRVYMRIIRLAHPVNTEIAITFYSPESIAGTKTAHAIDRTFEEDKGVIDEVLKNLLIVDWSLFCMPENGQ